MIDKNKLKELMEITGQNEIELLREITEEETRRLADEKFVFYEPNGKCEEFIKEVGSGERFVVMFSAANGVGKSVAGANILANIVYDSPNKYFDHPLYKKWPFPKKGRIVTETGNVEGVISTIKEWLPRGRYKTRKAGKAHESKWKSDTGFEWEIMTYNQDPKDFEGPTLGFVWFDEPPTKAIYKSCVSRLRKGGIIFISATPLEGSGWLYDHIVDGRSDDPDMQSVAKEQRINITAGVEAACKQHGVRGHLEHEDIQRMIAEYDEDERTARVEGKFQHLAGLRFKKWNRDVHVIKPFTIDQRHYCVYEYIDPHPRNNDAVLWIAVNSKLQYFVCDELWIKCQNGIEELASNIKKKAESYRVVYRAGDPSMFVKDQHGNTPLATKLSNEGLYYAEATKKRTESDTMIAEALMYNRLPTGEFVTEPKVYVFETCNRLMFEMEHYRWDEWSGKTGEKHDRKEKTVDKDDHMIENLGRFLFSIPVFVPVPPKISVPKTDNEYDPYA